MPSFTLPLCIYIDIIHYQKLTLRKLFLPVWHSEGNRTSTVWNKIVHEILLRDFASCIGIQIAHPKKDIAHGFTTYVIVTGAIIQWRKTDNMTTTKQSTINHPCKMIYIHSRDTRLYERDRDVAVHAANLVANSNNVTQKVTNVTPLLQKKSEKNPENTVPSLMWLNLI